MTHVDPSEMRDLALRGVNVASMLRSRGLNQFDVIRHSYDAQAGSYTQLMADPTYAAHKQAVGVKLASIIASFSPDSVLDAGVGEATTLVSVLRAMPHLIRVMGCDCSPERLFVARQNLLGLNSFSCDIGAIPLASGSVDVVMTMHAIEPNLGREREIVTELLRVARKAVIMVEPSYELGSDATRRHIEQFHYVCGLPQACGASLVRHEIWGLDVNPSNEAALMVAVKT